MTSTYRIIERRVNVCNGWYCWRERRFIAQRRVRIPGLFPIWWSIGEFDPCVTIGEAKRIVDYDRDLRKPLMNPITLED